MIDLHIHPTSRAAREHLATLEPEQNLTTTVITVAEFLQKTLYVADKTYIDKHKRMLFFKENIDSSLFTKSQTVFKLFEELAFEGVALDELFLVDPYAEFSAQIEELMGVKKSYKNYLDAHGYTDRAFIPNESKISWGYLDGFCSITLYLDGYLTKFEYKTFCAIAKMIPFQLDLTIDRFSQKNIKRFKEFDLQVGYRYLLELQSKQVLQKTKLDFSMSAEVVAVNKRYEQIFFIFDKINILIESGISPQNIVVILPDESYKNMIKAFDRNCYLNFAMGFDFVTDPLYKKLEAIYKLLTINGAIDKQRVAFMQSNFKIPQKPIDVDQFLRIIEDIEPLQHEQVKQELFYFSKRYKDQQLSFKEFLYLFLQTLKDIRVDDVRGGKVTVMGALESRGVAYDGVIIVDFNENYVPKVNQKDIYLNSALKSKLNLPTRSDRERLQKHLYLSLITKAKKAFISYTVEEPKSRFIYDLGLQEAKEINYSTKNFFNASSYEPGIETQLEFDPTAYRWSATMLQTFLQCRVKFYLRYHKKIKEAETDSINEGAILHDVLAKSENFSYNCLASEITKAAPDSLHKELWLQKIEPFVEFHKSYDAKVVAKELQKEGVIDGLLFSGRADRIDLAQDGKHLLIDYKSGNINNRMRNIENETDFQMVIYSILFKEFKPELAYMPIFEPKLIYIKEFDAKLEQFHQQLKELKQTRTLEVKKCENRAICRYCAYTIFCKRGDYI